MLVKCLPGRAIRDPGTKRLVPDHGQDIDPTNLFWARVLMQGDVVELTPGEVAAFHAAEDEPELVGEPAAQLGAAPDPALAPKAAPPPPAAAPNVPAAPVPSGPAALKPEGNDA